MLASGEHWLPGGGYFRSLVDKAQMGPLISSAVRLNRVNGACDNTAGPALILLRQ